MKKQFRVAADFDFEYAHNPERMSKYQEHTHASFELFYLMQGSAHFLIHDKIYRISDNTLLIVPPHVVHSIAYFSTAIERTVLHISENAVPDAFLASFKRLASSTLYIPANPSELTALVKHIHAEYQKKPFISEKRIQNLVQGLLSYLLCNASLPSSGLRITHPLINTFLRYIDENYEKNISLQEAAEHFYINRSYLSRLFHHHIGCTYPQYVRDIRFNVAKQLLLQTRSSVTEIANQVGFADSNYFSALFSKCEGSSPRKFRSRLTSCVEKHVGSVGKMG